MDAISTITLVINIHVLLITSLMNWVCVVIVCVWVVYLFASSFMLLLVHSVEPVLTHLWYILLFQHTFFNIACPLALPSPSLDNKATITL